MGLLKWLRPSAEGKDGKSSARALTNGWYVFVNTCIIIFMCVQANIIIDQDVVNNEAVRTLWVIFWVFAVINAVILLIFGIITLQNLTELTRAIKGDVPQPVQVETHTTTQITQPTSLEEEIKE